MGLGPDKSFLHFGAFDKTKSPRLSAQERAKWDGRPQPLVRQDIWANCFPSGRTPPVVWLELLTQERSMPWTPRAAVAAHDGPRHVGDFCIGSRLCENSVPTGFLQRELCVRIRA
jgi:hypothetical protein